MLSRYFDWAASGPPDSDLLAAALARSSALPGNPSARHAAGREARRELEAARGRCAAALGVAVETLYFTSGGSESNALVLQSWLLRPDGAPIAASAIEHPAVAENAKLLAKAGRKLLIVKPDASGRVTPETLAAALGAGSAASNLAAPRLVAVMAVNNETGALMDTAELVRTARLAVAGKPIHFHCDAVQAIGKVPVDLKAWDVDTAAFTAHKLGGPRGVGLLYAKKPFASLGVGGGQERGLRSGTENLFGALAMADILERRAAPAAVAAGLEIGRRLGERLIRGLRAIPGSTTLPADRAPRDDRFSPWIVQAAFSGVPAEVLVRVLDDAGFAVSTGSACHSASKERPVLEAMGISRELAFCAVRLSFGPATAEGDVDELLAAIRAALRQLGKL
jgi:cysteine desulfurase